MKTHLEGHKYLSWRDRGGHGYLLGGAYTPQTCQEGQGWPPTPCIGKGRFCERPPSPVGPWIAGQARKVTSQDGAAGGEGRRWMKDGGRPQNCIERLSEDGSRTASSGGRRTRGGRASANPSTPRDEVTRAAERRECKAGLCRRQNLQKACLKRGNPPHDRGILYSSVICRMRARGTPLKRQRGGRAAWSDLARLAQPGPPGPLGRLACLAAWPATTVNSVWGLGKRPTRGG